ncbi:MAG: hypothetical protein MRZ45_01155 [Blautia sp.]|nr:hypothetical protein [Blautia sp.]MDY4515338.1 hypothetical protein [Lachnospiraceae bacterium]
MNEFFVLGIVSMVAVCLEVALIFVEEFAYCEIVKRRIQIVSRVMMVVCTIFFLVLFGVCLWICVGLFLKGDIVAALKMVISSIIVAVGIYVLFVRRFLKSIKRKQ